MMGIKPGNIFVEKSCGQIRQFKMYFSLFANKSKEAIDSLNLVGLG